MVDPSPAISTVLGSTEALSDSFDPATCQLLFAQNPQPMGIVDAHSLAFLAANQALVDQYGYTRARFLAMTLADLDAPESSRSAELDAAGYAQAAYNPAHSPLTLVHQLQNGSEIDIELTLAPLTFAGQSAFLVTFKDVSDRRRVQTAQAEQERLLEAATSALPTVIYIFDLLENRNVYANRSLTQHLGYAPEEIQSAAEEIFPKLIHPDDLPLVQKNLATLPQLRNDEILISEYRIRHRDGDWRWFYDRIAVLKRTDSGDVWQVVVASVDVSERKQSEQAIQQLNQLLEQQNQNLEALVAQRTAELSDRTAQLEVINRELESFSYSVSHDLRAPLRHISGFIVALANRLQGSSVLADPKVTHYLEIIDTSSRKMGALIDGLLTLSQIGRRQMAVQPVSLMGLAEAAITLHTRTPPGGQTSRRKIEFELTQLPTVQGDATLLQQVFSNLIDNAIKFSIQAEQPVVRIGSLADGTVFIQDNGVGFPMKCADQLFGAFQRLHSQQEFQGTGIGLAIVERIVHRHGGVIWAESEPNRGATFYIRFKQTPPAQ